MCLSHLLREFRSKNANRAAHPVWHATTYPQLVVVAVPLCEVASLRAATWAHIAYRLFTAACHSQALWRRARYRRKLARQRRGPRDAGPFCRLPDIVSRASGLAGASVALQDWPGFPPAPGEMAAPVGSLLPPRYCWHSALLFPRKARCEVELVGCVLQATRCHKWSIL